MGASEIQMGQSASHVVRNEAAEIQDLLELSHRCRAVAGPEVSLTPKINWVHWGDSRRQIKRFHRLKECQSPLGVAIVKLNLRTDRRQPVILRDEQVVDRGLAGNGRPPVGVERMLRIYFFAGVVPPESHCAFQVTSSGAVASSATSRKAALSDICLAISNISSMLVVGCHPWPFIGLPY
jgi:hypothetical protein